MPIGRHSNHKGTSPSAGTTPGWTFGCFARRLIAPPTSIRSDPPRMPPLSPEPSRKLTIVTCMDCRIDLQAALGIEIGEAHVLRNAGGVVTDDVIRSLAISQRKLGTREVLVIHHTGCGMQTISDDGFRAELQRDTGVAPHFAIEAFSDLDEDVRQSVRRVRRSQFIPHRGRVRGYVLDVDTQELREVELPEDSDE